MKTFQDLTKDQKITAILTISSQIITLVADGTIEMTLADESNQERLEFILSEARRKEAPRLTVLRILRDVKIKSEVHRVAIVVAADAQYNDDGSVAKKVGQD